MNDTELDPEAARTLDFARLRRYPDLEAANLVAVDATDRLVLDEAATAILAAGSGNVAVVGDHYGALTLGTAAMLASQGGHAGTLRVHQDALLGEHALDHNAASLDLTGTYIHHDLDGALFAGAEVVLVQAPKSLAALREIAELTARHASPTVRMFVGGRTKHMTLSMNTVLGNEFQNVRASLARQKSRVLVADAPRASTTASAFPMRAHHDDLNLDVYAFGAAFAGTKIDIGTRQLLRHLDEMKPDALDAIDLGCGTGVLAACLAKARPRLRVLATDQSAGACASATATVDANGLSGQVEVVRDHALDTCPDASIDLVVCNPPFHIGTEVHEGVALTLFDAAARVLRPGGELWVVYNSPLDYRPALRTKVGHTSVVERGPKFTVTRSVR